MSISIPCLIKQPHRQQLTISILYIMRKNLALLDIIDLLVSTLIIVGLITSWIVRDKRLGVGECVMFSMQVSTKNQSLNTLIS